MIDRIELIPLEDSPGVAISIYYDTDCMDTFSVFNAEHADVIKKILLSRGPGDVLITIRDFGRFPLH